MASRGWPAIRAMFPWSLKSSTAAGSSVILIGIGGL